MQDYDTLEDFIDYADKEKWSGYIKNSIIPLWKASHILIRFHESLKKEFDGKSFNEFSEEDKVIFLGGVVNKENRFSETSLAKFYNDFFDLKIDIPSWMIQEEIGEKFEDLIAEINES